MRSFSPIHMGDRLGHSTHARRVSTESTERRTHSAPRDCDFLDPLVARFTRLRDGCHPRLFDVRGDRFGIRSTSFIHAVARDVSNTDFGSTPASISGFCGDGSRNLETR